MAARLATRNTPPYPFTSGAELLAQCQASGLTHGAGSCANEAQMAQPR